MTAATADKIDELLAELNDEQKKCVKNLDGKFLVLAGPGTGKTHTVIKRLQAMILQGIKPERILCMTYSRAGANEMKKRVLEELEENNNNVEIHTFHSFCNKIISEYAEEFDVTSNVKVIPESISNALIKECIDDMVDAKYYKSTKANKYASLESISKGIQLLKRYRITDKDGNILEANIKSDSDWQKVKEDLIRERDFNPKPNKKYEDRIRDIDDKINKARELYKFFLLYREKMELGGYIDYDDMINYILEKFESDSTFAAEISNQYDYIIIDEYQDTNRLQNELIFHLVDNSEKGNIFVVGDDKQIVNASQGARIDSMKTFSEKYKIGEKQIIKFTENFRSTQTILDVAKLVAEQNTELLTKDIGLNAADNKELKAKEKKVRLNIYKDEERQANHIVKEIEDILASADCPRDKKTGEIDYSQIAILSTNKEELKYYSELLHNKNIPYELKEGKNIFEVKSSVLLYYYLQTLVNPDANSDKIFRLLLLPPFSISPESYTKLYNEKSKHTNIIDAMKAIETDEKASDDIKNFISIYNELRETVLQGETVYRVVLKCASRTGIFDFFTTHKTNQLENTLALKRFLDEAYEYTGLYKKVSLEDFVSYLDMLQNDGQPLNIDKDEIKMNAIQLTTYQSAKGLEYEYVYMPTLQKSKWESNSWPPLKPNVPLSPLDEKDDETWRTYKLADKINKMYVGMTRAKHTLRLSYIGANGTEGASELLRINKIPKELLEINNYCDDKTEATVYKWAAAFTIKDFNYKEEYKSHIDSVLKKNEYYSPTFVNPYIKCPRRFFLDEILGLNSPNLSIPDAMNFGSAVHITCQKAVESAMEDKKFWSSDVFVDNLKKEIDKYPFSSLKQREQYKTIAETNIKEFYEKDLSLTKIDTFYKIEKKIVTDFAGVQFKGLPDRINLVDGKFRIYDYKTGKPKSKKEICLTNPDDENLGEHEDYYIQLGLYKYFLEQTDELGRKVEETTFLFPQDYKKPCTVDYTEDDINKILDKYKAAIKGIQNHDFEPTPSKISCSWCPYKEIFCEVMRVEDKKEN